MDQLTNFFAEHERQRAAWAAYAERCQDQERRQRAALQAWADQRADRARILSLASQPRSA